MRSLLNAACSWEPQENVQQCERLLTSFWKHIGTDDNDYSVGYEIAAQDYWIRETRLPFISGVSDYSGEEEKNFFAKQFAGEGKRNSEDNKKRKVGAPSHAYTYLSYARHRRKQSLRSQRKLRAMLIARKSPMFLSCRPRKGKNAQKDPLIQT